VLTGKAAEEFIKQDSKPLTVKQKQSLKEAEEVYRQTKRR
jgi:hypothetical protein